MATIELKIGNRVTASFTDQTIADFENESDKQAARDARYPYQVVMVQWLNNKKWYLCAPINTAHIGWPFDVELEAEWFDAETGISAGGMQIVSRLRILHHQPQPSALH